MSEHACRACKSKSGDLVFDLGLQSASDYFPECSDPGPDPLYPLQMWLCAKCGLAQLMDDATTAEEPRAIESKALVAQAADAVGRVAAAGLLPAGATVAEYGSPHGGSWLTLLTGHGLEPVSGREPADVIVDCFGMMHAADQGAALAERTARLAPGGVLLLQYHSLEAIIRCGQWNALRHGHYAYYSTTALVAMLAAHGLGVRAAWQFDLYGGTVLLAAGRLTDGFEASDDTVQSLVEADAECGVRDPNVLRRLERDSLDRAGRLHSWLVSEQAAGHTVIGYGAASRAVALLRQARVDRNLLPAIADASPAKHGLRMPGTDVPIVDTTDLVARRPDVIVLFVADLWTEVTVTFPELGAASGVRWIIADELGT